MTIKHALIFFLGIGFLSACSLYQSEGRKAVEDGSINITYKSQLTSDAETHCRHSSLKINAEDLLDRQIVEHKGASPAGMTLGYHESTQLWWLIAASDSHRCQFAFSSMDEVQTLLPVVVVNAEIYLSLLDQSP